MGCVPCVVCTHPHSTQLPHPAPDGGKHTHTRTYPGDLLRQQLTLLRAAGEVRHGGAEEAVVRFFRAPTLSSSFVPIFKYPSPSTCPTHTLSSPLFSPISFRLAPYASGEQLGCFGLSEPGNGTSYVVVASAARQIIVPNTYISPADRLSPRPPSSHRERRRRRQHHRRPQGCVGGQAACARDYRGRSTQGSPPPLFFP